MSWGAARKALAPLLGGEEKKLKFNLEAGGERELLGNPLEAKLSAIFGKDWEDHPRKQAIRDTVPACLWAADYGVAGTQRVVIRPASERKALRAQASQAFVADLDVTEEQAQALCDLTLPSGWEPYSIEALRAILPQLEAGVRFGTLINSREPEWENWRAATFPNREQPTGELYDRLPSPAVKDERERLKAVRNPTVVRVQNELRKVVNTLIDLFGKPDLIRVEVARDIGRSKRDREEVQAFQRRQELQRRKAEQNLTENHIVNPSNDDIEKWLLWKECGERCPYSGDAIGFADLFGELPKFEVEHIWPCSRSFDDSFANKTLCRRDLNLKKGDKTPFEAFGADDDHWGRIVKWIDGITASKGKPGMPRKKVRRFLAREMPDDFANRQLTDTSYAARQAVGSLKRLWPDLGPDAPVKVQAVTGRATAQLRRLWGLNKVLADDGEKTRADHRHHAVDALAVACIHPGMTQRLARYWQGRESGARSPEMSPPWPSLRQDAQAAVARIVVSHRVRKKVSGPLHKETVYGDTGCDVMSGKVAYRALAYRVPIAKITPAILLADDLADARTIVRDGGVRRALRDHLARFGGDAKKAFAEAPTLGPDGPAIHSVRLLTKQQADLLAPVANGFADLGNNHHVAIYCLADGSTDFEIVGLFEAARRIARREPVVCRDRGDGSTFLMSLSQGDTLEFPEGDHKGFRVVQSVWSSGVVETRAHIDATKDKDAVWRPNANSLIKMGARKISVDPIGRVRKASD
jgi:CRISPR-associated endonuclease Csn1